MTLDKTMEWIVSALFVLIFTIITLWVLGLLFGTLEKAIAVYLLIWVMLWDRRHVAKIMRDYEASTPPTTNSEKG